VLPDESLVRDAKQGESAAYAELARRWSAPILAVCQARVRCRHSAEDLAQETLLRGWESIQSLQDNRKVGAWLRGIAQHVCLDWLKRHQNQQVPFSVVGEAAKSGDGFADNSISPAEQFFKRSEEERLQAEIDRLPEDERETLLLYASGEWTYQQLAELLDVAVGTINARLARARERLCRHLRIVRETKS
jgi:RNA polymerase sigma factor (sigma-70 family)